MINVTPNTIAIHPATGRAAVLGYDAQVYIVPADRPLAERWESSLTHWETYWETVHVPAGWILPK